MAFNNLACGVACFVILVSSYHEVRRAGEHRTTDYWGVFFVALICVSLLTALQCVRPGHAGLGDHPALRGFRRLRHRVPGRGEADEASPHPDGVFHDRTFTVKILTASILGGAQMAFEVYFPM